MSHFFASSRLHKISMASASEGSTADTFFDADAAFGLAGPRHLAGASGVTMPRAQSRRVGRGGAPRRVRGPQREGCGRSLGCLFSTGVLDGKSTRRAAERGAQPGDHHRQGCTAQRASSSRRSSPQHLPFKPHAGHAQEEEFAGLEEHSFEFDLALFDTGHRKHPPLPSPPLASQHAASLRPCAPPNPPICPLRAGRPSRPSRPRAPLSCTQRKRGGLSRPK